MNELRPCTIGPMHSFSTATYNSLHKNYDGGQRQHIISDTSQDGSFAWIGIDNFLEVVSCVNGQRLAAHCFGAIIGEHHMQIVDIVEFCYDQTAHLLIATTTPSSKTTLINLFDISTSAISKVIEVPARVCVLERVSSVGLKQNCSSILSAHLRQFCGVLAVGTQEAHVYLIDLNLDDDTEKSTEFAPSDIQFLDLNTRDITNRRHHALCKQKHLCVELGEENHKVTKYEYRKANGSVIQTYHPDDVHVTSLHFNKHLVTLCVGYNFGCFQMWNLKIPELTYSSRLEDNLSPVTHMTFLEPENDPRNFYYLWVNRGPASQQNVNCTSNMMIFQLEFKKKVWHDGIGFVYENLDAVLPRFYHDFSGSHSTSSTQHASDKKHQARHSTVASRVVFCKTIEAQHSPDQVPTEDGSNEGVISMSVAAVLWECVSSNNKSSWHMALFDLNRYYHAQLPVSIRLHKSHEMNQFLSVYNLTESFVGSSQHDRIVTGLVPITSMSRFHSPLTPMPEQQFFPSSLAFDLTCVTLSGVAQVKFLGIQRQILCDMQSIGPSALVEPRELYCLCVYAGLLPKSADLSKESNKMRELLLSVAVDNGLVSFVAACIKTWGSKEFANVGCTLRLLLDWTWAKIVSTKEAIDRTCTTLYDWSGRELDQHTKQILNHHYITLTHLATVLQAFIDLDQPITAQGHFDLDAKLRVVHLLIQYLRVVLCFYSLGFLPEHAEDEKNLPNNQFGYPVTILHTYYTERRATLSALHREVGEYDVLLIDGLISPYSSALRNAWLSDDASDTAAAGYQSTIVYPPPSLQALLNMYLIADIPLLQKHVIAIYTLIDTMSHVAPHNCEQVQEKLLFFSHSFGISDTLNKFVHGIWLVDHKEFDEAMTFLLEPAVTVHLSKWHKRIIKTFLYHNRPDLALQYVRMKQPPLLTAEDVKLRLTVLIANSLTSEAFYYQRKTRDTYNSEDLLSHLYLGCHQTKNLDRLLQLPLNEFEEQQLVSHLSDSKDKKLNELLVMYYLQRSKYLDAIITNNNLTHAPISDSKEQAHERVNARNAIVHCYQQVLPHVQRKVTYNASKEHTKRKMPINRHGPVPLSAVVNRSSHQKSISRATLIQSLLERIDETYTASLPTPVTPVKSSLEHTPTTSRTSVHGSIADVRVTVSKATGATTENSAYHEASITADGTFTSSILCRSSLPKECESVLRTPKIHRKKIASRNPSPQSNTPHSILKARNKRKPFVRKKKSVAAAMRTPTPPRVAIKSPTVETPKQIRFALNDEDSKKTEAIDDQHEPVGDEEWHSVKDRSPTPERLSPKQYRISEEHERNIPCQDDSDTDMSEGEEESGSKLSSDDNMDTEDKDDNEVQEIEDECSRDDEPDTESLATDVEMSSTEKQETSVSSSSSDQFNSPLTSCTDEDTSSLAHHEPSIYSSLHDDTEDTSARHVMAEDTVSGSDAVQVKTNDDDIIAMDSIDSVVSMSANSAVTSGTALSTDMYIDDTETAELKVCDSTVERKAGEAITSSIVKSISSSDHEVTTKEVSSTGCDLNALQNRKSSDSRTCTVLISVNDSENIPCNTAENALQNLPVEQQKDHSVDMSVSEDQDNVSLAYDEAAATQLADKMTEPSHSVHLDSTQTSKVVSSSCDDEADEAHVADTPHFVPDATQSEMEAESHDGNNELTTNVPMVNNTGVAISDMTKLEQAQPVHSKQANSPEHEIQKSEIQLESMAIDVDNQAVKLEELENVEEQSSCEMQQQHTECLENDRKESFHEQSEQPLAVEHESSEQQVDVEHENSEQQVAVEHENSEQQLAVEHEDSEQQLAVEHKGSEHEQQLVDEPMGKHAQNEEQPVSEDHQNEKQLIDEHEQSEEQPTVEHEQSEEQPIVEHEQSEEQPIVEHEQNEDQPIGEHEESEEQLTMEHEQTEQHSTVHYEQNEHCTVEPVHGEESEEQLNMTLKDPASNASSQERRLTRSTTPVRRSSRIHTHAKPAEATSMLTRSGRKKPQPTAEQQNTSNNTRLTRSTSTKQSVDTSLTHGRVLNPVKEHELLKAEDLKTPVKKNDTGPLSSHSFMMSLRSGRSISRETTPEPHIPQNTRRSRRSVSRDATPIKSRNSMPGIERDLSPANSDVTNVSDSTSDSHFMDNAMDFEFSKPLSSPLPPDKFMVPTDHEKVHSFVFSPPMTRAQHRMSVDKLVIPQRLTPDVTEKNIIKKSLSSVKQNYDDEFGINLFESPDTATPPDSTDKKHRMTLRRKTLPRKRLSERRQYKLTQPK